METKGYSQKMEVNVRKYMYRIILGLLLLCSIQIYHEISSTKKYKTYLVSASFNQTFSIFPRRKMQSEQIMHPSSEPSQPVPQVEPHTKEQMDRMHRVRSLCKQKRFLSNHMPKSLFVSERQKLLYCSVPKVACTNWKRMMQVFEGAKYDKIMKMDKQKIHRLRYKYLHRNYKVNRQKQMLSKYFKFIFVRHPFERLLSAYRNKFVDPYNNIYQRRHGSQILKMYRTNLTKQAYNAGKNVTFGEFIQYIVDTHRKDKSKLDIHWNTVVSLCNPCAIGFDYVGKMETLVDDSNRVLKNLHLPWLFPANYTDKYSTSVRTQFGKFETLSPQTLGDLYEIYRNDFDLFGYELPDFLTKRMKDVFA